MVLLMIEYPSIIFDSYIFNECTKFKTEVIEEAKRLLYDTCPKYLFRNILMKSDIEKIILPKGNWYKCP